VNLRLKYLKNQKGFSLIEIIITVTIASTLFAMMFAYFGSSIFESTKPVTQLSKSLSLTQTAEKITANYRQDPSVDLKILQKNLVKNPSQYGQNYSIVLNQFIKFINYNDTPAKGKDPKNILKVKIRQDDTNETITLLFTQQ
jgi:prepilin-type N-terminal cleavage/methylation domain-containing protein